ncbi:hypothetical protein CALCODRAFT_543658 [Calocera cornea HHB12733]|uniref:Uncharacterized protein n=1 Tax=Calocera cornea HHB12733 TaxID=1353952 RepID=A0A165FBM7_9BASI|nr:hypothetical protein CALCODRAFT_543658 [Calocera cornea HHB12733]
MEIRASTPFSDHVSLSIISPVPPRRLHGFNLGGEQLVEVPDSVEINFCPFFLERLPKLVGVGWEGFPGTDSLVQDVPSALNDVHVRRVGRLWQNLIVVVLEVLHCDLLLVDCCVVLLEDRVLEGETVVV